MSNPSSTDQTFPRGRSVFVFWVVAVLTLLAVDVVLRALGAPGWILRWFVLTWVLAGVAGALIVRRRV